jgi:sulfur carrier protein ThiS adenylyltransferase
MTNRLLKQMLLPEIGLEGQKKLARCRVLVLGAGGLGVPVSLGLSASGLGAITLCDHDTIEQSNLSRQFLYNESHVGEKKVVVLSKQLKSLNPHLQTSSLQARLTTENAHRLIENSDMVINCTDNLEARLALNQACLQANIPWLDAALSSFSGQLCAFLPENGCYACLFPNIKPPKQNCHTEGVFTPLCGTVGFWAASEAIKVLLGFAQPNTLISFHLKQNRVSQIHWKKNPHCVVCQKQNIPGPRKEIHQKKPPLLRPSENPSETVIVHVGPCMDSRLPTPHIQCSLEDFFSKDLEDPLFIQKYADKNKRYGCVCEFGVKSKLAVQQLQAEGYQAFVLSPFSPN